MIKRCSKQWPFVSLLIDVRDGCHGHKQAYAMNDMCIQIHLQN